MKKIYRTALSIILTLVFLLVCFGCQPNQTAISDNSITGNIVKESSTVVEQPTLQDAVKTVEKSSVLVYLQEDEISWCTGTILDIYKSDGAGGKVIESGVYYILTAYERLAAGGTLTISCADSDGKCVGDNGYDEKYTFSAMVNSLSGSGNISVVTVDKKLDLAVIRIETDITLPKVKLAKVNTQVLKGQDAFLIGCTDRDDMNRLSVGRIGYVDRLFTINGGYFNAMELDIAAGYGNGGGGVFNKSAEVIGTVYSAIDGNNFAVGIKDIYQFLQTRFVIGE